MISNVREERNIASFSDVHLGHKNTLTTHILSNLDNAFRSSTAMSQFDAIFLSGDLFDQSLMLHDPAVAHIKSWMFRVLRMCKKHDIELWILEGTPSHDWRQSSWFKFLNEEAEIGAKVYYVDTLSIQFSEKLGSILCVPDEWAPETDDTWRQVQQLLQQHQLEKVDYAMMHGSFAYQLPAHVTSPKHDPERYLSIVDKIITVGHVHKPSQYDRILANGSFDRLTHGEEEPKGWWHIKVGPNGNEMLFVENKGAKIYRTVDCGELSVDDALTKLDEQSTLPPGSAVRVEASKGAPILSSLDILRKKHPHITWTSKVAEGAQTQTKMLVDLRSNFTQIAITRSNIRELLMERVRSQTSDPVILDRCEQRLMEITQ